MTEEQILTALGPAMDTFNAANVKVLLIAVADGEDYVITGSHALGNRLAAAGMMNAAIAWLRRVTGRSEAK